ncbi:MAG: hypothetical protein ACXVPQ_00960, partial [Bacteroidia bacterium]
EALNKKKRDTLIYAGNIAMLFNIKDLINKHYNIQKIKVSKAICHLSISKSGEPNYLFWKSDPAATGSDSLNFTLESIELNDIALQYRNHKDKLKTAVHFDHSEFSGDFKQSSYEMTSSGKGYLAYLEQNKTPLLNNKTIRYQFDIRINAGNYEIATAELAVNEMFFGLSGNFVLKDSLQSAALSFEGKKLDIAAVLSLLPEKHAARINDYSSEGEFFTTGKIKYKAGSPADVKAEFGIKNATVTYKPKNTKLERLNLNGSLGINQSESYLNLQNVSAGLGSNSFNGFCLITNLQDPYLNLSAGIDTKLEELNAFWPIDTLEYISGALQLKVAIKGKLKEIQQSAFSPNIEASGHATLKDIKTKLKGSAGEINVSGGSFTLENRNVSVNDFNILIGTSDLQLTGSLPEFLNYLFDSKKPFTINADLQSKNLALEDLLFSSGGGASQQVNIPANLDFNIRAAIGKLSFSKFEATNVKGAVAVQDQKIVVKEFALSTMDGEAALNAYADASGENIRITATASLKNINISKLFYQCNNFGQNTLNDKHLKGFATADIEFSGNWSKELKADLKSIAATSNVLIERGELMNFKPLESLSKYVEVQELRDIKFSSLQSVIDIKDQVITIPKTSIKNSALNIELWGRHTFSNEIEYHFQLLLSELLMRKKRANKGLDEELDLVENDPENRRSVFISMTGTVDNPVIRYDKKGLRQKIGSDIKAEKQNLKQLLKEEFGLFKKDSTLKKTEELKADQKFKIEFGDKPVQPKKDLQPRKQEEDDDF